MGAQSSKINNNKKDISTSEAYLPSTPISTPKPKEIDWDPRSPSANIVRTPIQSAVDLNQAETPIIGVLKAECDEQVTIDPRSPTVEFTRTPIIINNEPYKPRNKNLDHVRQQLTNFSPMKPHGTEINPTRNKGPILLGVSPVTKKINQEKRKSYIGLLETDLDFVETDLDEVVKPNISLKQNQIQEEIEHESIVTESDDEPKEKLIKTESEFVEQPEEKLNGTFSIEPIEEVIETHVINSSIEKEEINTSNNTTNEKEEIKKVMSDKEILISPIKETLEKIIQIDKDIKEVIAIAHNSIPMENIDDETLSNAFDKKVTNLIYEDQKIINIPKNIKQNNGGNRTPLGERNINQNSKKSTSKLRVHDKPIMNKNDYVVSKIPVFKEKKGKSKISQQCENTPPRQMTDIKHKKTQWDSDKTMLI